MRELPTSGEREEQRKFEEIWEMVGGFMEREREVIKVRDTIVAEYDDHVHRIDSSTAGEFEAVLLKGGVAGRITINKGTGSPYLVGFIERGIFWIPSGGKTAEKWEKIVSSRRKIYSILEDSATLIVGINSGGDVYVGKGWGELRENSNLNKEATPDFLGILKKGIELFAVEEGYHHL